MANHPRNIHVFDVIYVGPRWIRISRTAYMYKIQQLFLVKTRKITVISSSQLTHQVQLGLDLVMATVGLGKGHEKENFFPDQGE